MIFLDCFFSDFSFKNKMRKKNSISSIAKELGVSPTTVSFVLNGKAKEKRISEASEKRILEYVEKVGFKPNELAKSLRTGKTKIIGLIIEDISNAFYANIARYMEYAAYSRGYRIIYCSTDNKPQKAKELIQMFKNQHVDGFIVTPTPQLEECLEGLIEENYPVVLFDRHLENISTDYVITNNFEGAYSATSHLIQEGFKKIALVTLKDGQSQMQARREGYLKALNENQLEPVFCEIQHGIGDIDSVKAFSEFYKDFDGDALFFTTNYLGVIAIRTLKEMGKEIPGMVSFDDHTLFRLFSPTISVVSQPLSKIADELIKIMLEKLSGQSNELRQVVLPSELIIRESSKR